MVVKLDASLKGLIEDIAGRLLVGSSVSLQPAREGIITCTDVDGQVAGHLSVEQVQHLPASIRSGVVRSLRKQDGHVSEVLVRFTGKPAPASVASGVLLNSKEADFVVWRAAFSGV